MENFNSLPDKYLQSNFPKWMFWSCVSQFIFSLFFFALCAYATSEFKIGSTTVVSGFVGLNMFTVSLLPSAVPLLSKHRSAPLCKQPNHICEIGVFDHDCCSLYLHRPSQTAELLSRLWRGRTGILPLLFLAY
jgi:hypothetical protein